MVEDRTCLQCNAPAKLQCSRCRLVWFCSAACQRAAWKSHKESCRLPAQPWHKLPAADRSRTLDAVQSSLQKQGLDAVVAVAREVEVLSRLSSVEEPGSPNAEEETPRLMLLGFASTTQQAALDALRAGPLSAVTDVHEVVTVAAARTPPGEAVREACRQSWSRCHGSPATAVQASDVDRIRATVLGAMRDETAVAFSLRLVRRREVWAGCAGVTELQGVQLEGFAPAALREKLGPFASLAVAVEWYVGPWQGAMLALRDHSGWRRSDLPEPPLRLVPPPKNVAVWLERQEQLFGSIDLAAASVPRGLPDWREGSKALCDAPKIQVFPHFLSDAECTHLLRLALCFQQPPAGESPATAVPLPGRLADETLEAVEARMAVALGLQPDTADPKMAIVWEEKGDGQFVRRNTSGSKAQAVRGKMVVWLSAGPGGELRFPWAGANSAGPGSVTPDTSSLASTQERLLAASESGDALTVVPRRGMAIAIAVQNEDGREDERTWHVQRAWVKHGAWTLQKLWLTQAGSS